MKTTVKKMRNDKELIKRENGIFVGGVIKVKYKKNESTRQINTF